MKDFTGECISLALNVDIREESEDNTQSGTKFYHRSKNQDDHFILRSVESAEAAEALRDVDKTVFLLNRDHSNSEINEKQQYGDRSGSKSNEINLVEYGILGKNKALSSVFLLDDVLLPLLRQEVSKSKTSNLRSSLHLTYAKKFATHVCRFDEQTMKGVKLSLPNLNRFRQIDEGYLSGTDRDLQELEESIEGWIQSIQGVIQLEHVQSSKKDLKSPLEEVEFWRRRHTVFSDIVEQLKNNKAKAVLDILKFSGSTCYGKLHDLVNDVSTHEAEAAENMKFLTTLERHFRVLNDGSLDGICSTIPALLDGMRMVWTISKFYCRDERMLPLMVLVAKQISSKVKVHVNLQDMITKEYAQSYETLVKAKKVLEQWKSSYIMTREKIEIMGKGQRQWEFDRSSLFETTDYMADICSQLIKAITTIDDLNQFLKPEVNRVMGFTENDAIQFEELASLQKLFLDFAFDPFHHANGKEWIKLTKKFDAAVADVEHHADAFLQKSFRQLRSSEGSFQLIQHFRSLMSRPSVQKIVTLRYQDMLLQYEQELEAIEDHFINFKDDPPLAFGVHKSSGSILWAKGLYLRAKRPILLFQKEENLLDSGLGFKVKNSYLRFARSVETYNQLIFETWEEHARFISSRSLRMPLLEKFHQESSTSHLVQLQENSFIQKKVVSNRQSSTKVDMQLDRSNINENSSQNDRNTRLRLNFTSTLRDLIDESNHFASMGYTVPREALHFTLQQQMINR